ncbi:acyltransferase family-domain-containing protein [Xylariaceae sp. FL0016]|nr:acyltransferase family-domain-containing protein [Xylariaceae sp. FL0016]
MHTSQQGILDCESLEDIKVNEPPSSSLHSISRQLPYLGHLLKPVKQVLQLSGPAKHHSPEDLRPTAYLDGLRGFAAFLVYWHHHQLWAHGATGQNITLEDSFGYERKYHFAALYGVRTFFTGGHYAVATFFVISGYVLSAKPLRLLQANDRVQLGDNIASALFRRWLRLYLPLFATTFIYMTTWHVWGLWIANAEPQSSWGDELWSWYVACKNFSFVFNTSGEPWITYQYHAWSIQVEFKGSVIIYTSLLAFSRLSTNARLWCQGALIFYFLYIADGWYGAMFMSGMLMCDLHILSEKNKLPTPFQKLWPIKTFLSYHLLAASIYLGGVPSVNPDFDRMRQQRGWYYLSLLKPQAVFDYKWFYLFWAAMFLVGSIPNIPWLKRFFENRFCQYLGRISFAFYLVHGPVLWTIGDRLYTAAGWYQEPQRNNLPQWVNRFEMAKFGPLGMELSFLVPHLMLLPLTIWLASMVTRLIDEPSVRFGQRLYGSLQSGSRPVQACDLEIISHRSDKWKASNRR